MRVQALPLQLLDDPHHTHDANGADADDTVANSLAATVARLIDGDTLVARLADGSEGQFG
jgi:Na+-transporting NADH:ubiquinone oxidoreductase subunit NqrA